LNRVTNHRRATSVAFGMILLCAMGGCSARTPNGPTSMSDAELQKLAQDYVSKRTTAAENASIYAAIRKLTPVEARSLHEHIGRLNAYSGFEERAFDASFEYAQAHGKSFVDLTPEEGAMIMSKLTGGSVEDIRTHEERNRQ
jgi:hypothetical protein